MSTEVEKHNGGALQQHEEPKTILQVIAQAAADPRVDVQKMQALLEMQQQIEKRQAEVEFNAALARLMPKIPRIEKSGVIMVQGKIRSKWARYEDLDAVVRPLLAEEGFSISFNTDDSTPKYLRITGTLSHRMGHNRTSQITLPITEGGQITGAQLIGSLTSYGRRYILCDALNIVTVDQDDDGRGGAKFITEEQAMTLHTLLADTKSSVPKFLEWIGADKVEAILDRDFQKAIKALQDKMRHG